MKNEESSSCAEKIFGSSLEKTFKQAMTPFEEFVHAEASSGLLLMACTIAAMGIANSGLFGIYENILHTKITIGGGKN